MAIKDFQPAWVERIPISMMQSISETINDLQHDAIFQVRESHHHFFYHEFIKELYQQISLGNLDQIMTLFSMEDNKIGEELKKLPILEARAFADGFVFTLDFMSVEAGLPEIMSYGMRAGYQSMIADSEKCSYLITIMLNASISYALHMKKYCADRKLSPEIIAAVNYIEFHLHEKIMLDDVAAYIHMSRRQLTRRFQAEVGNSIADFVNEEKMEEAINLLKFTHMSQIEISNYLAFSSESYFMKVFNEKVGLSPKEYRRLNLLTKAE